MSVEKKYFLTAEEAAEISYEKDKKYYKETITDLTEIIKHFTVEEYALRIDISFLVESTQKVANTELRFLADKCVKISIEYAQCVLRKLEILNKYEYLKSTIKELISTLTMLYRRQHGNSRRH